MKRLPFIERFENNYIPEPNSGCWIWVGTLKRDYNRNQNALYGRMRKEGVYYSSHRLSYETYKGDIPDKKCVLHKCDNTLCVNPDHLWLGTHDDNMQDKKLKGRCRNGWSDPLKIIPFQQNDF